MRRVLLIITFWTVPLQAADQFIPYSIDHLEEQKSILQDQEMIEFEGFSEDKVCVDFFNKSYPWQQSIGDYQFGAQLQTEANVKANCQLASAGAWAKIKGRVFEKELELASAEIAALASNESVSLRMGVMVLGYEIDRIDLNGKGSLTVSDSRNYNIDKTYTYATAIGPIPIKLEYGVEGKTTFGWSATVGLFSSQIKSAPKVDTRAFADGGISAIEILGLTVKGTMTLTKNEFLTQAGIGLANDQGKPALEVHAEIDNNWEALQGNISGSVRLLDESLIEKQFFAWDGYKDKRNLVSMREIIPMPKGHKS